MAYLPRNSGWYRKHFTMPSDWDSAYHEYAVERSASHIAFVIDGNTVGNWSGDTGESGDPAVPLLWPVPFHLILNTAVGGSWPGEPDEHTVFPTYHRVEYVRLSQQQETAVAKVQVSWMTTATLRLYFNVSTLHSSSSCLPSPCLPSRTTSRFCLSPCRWTRTTTSY